MEVRVPDGIVSPSCGADMQGLLHGTLPPLVLAGFRQFSSPVQQIHRHTKPQTPAEKKQHPAHPTTQNLTQADEQHPVPGLLHPVHHRASSVFNNVERFLKFFKTLKTFQVLTVFTTCYYEFLEICKNLYLPKSTYQKTFFACICRCLSGFLFMCPDLSIIVVICQFLTLISDCHYLSLFVVICLDCKKASGI